jgi:hypothetical protein
MTPAERRLFQDGFVSRYIDVLSEIPDRRNILNQVAAWGQVSVVWLRCRLVLLDRGLSKDIN